MKFTAYLVSWGLFWLGHILSKFVELTGTGYDLYSWCMVTSCNVQDRYDVVEGPWVSVEEEQESLNSSDEM